MEWIKDYWYIVVLGLVAAMFLFGHRTGRNTDTEVQDDDQHGPHAGEKAHKSGHGCCH